jgi:HD-GYP domain-containing protein (c-di-GMP phosphodiesterase class II)
VQPSATGDRRAQPACNEKLTAEAWEYMRRHTLIGSRIIAVCDAFDAMISDRSYRPAMPAAEALDELRGNAGTQFDPQIIEVFTELAGELARGELVLAA